MQALLLREYNKLSIEEVTPPTPGEDELLIAVAACGICGSDVHGFDGSTGRRVPPIIMGHEAAGTIVGLGASVTDFAVGDRVTFDSTIFCGACAFCLRGDVNLCNRREVIGVSCAEFRREGAFAEYLAVPARVAYRLPVELPFEHAAMLEAVSVALHAVAVAQLPPRASVLVMGAGMIGLLLLQAARARGAARVFVCDVDESRLRLARDMGADRTFRATGSALTEQVLTQTDAIGVDTVLEAVGLEETILAAIDCVRKGGTVTLVGNLSPKVTLPLQKVVSHQIRLQGSCASAGEYPEAMRLIASGAIRVAPLISAVSPLSEGPRWFERLHTHEPNLMKIVLDPRLQQVTG